MKNDVTKEAVSVAAALDEISAELGIPVTEIDYEVIVEPSKKLFGMGTERPATVRGWAKNEEDAEEGRAVAREILEIEEEPIEPEQATEPEAGPAVGSIGFTEEEVELTDKQLDMVADTATEALKEVLKGFGMEDPKIEEYEGEDGEIILDVVGDDLAVLIGRYGRTLEAIQMLIAMSTTKKLGFRYPVTIDVEGYKHRRRQKLEAIARSAASRAVRQKCSIRLQPMNPYDRRIVHLTLRDDDRIITQSEGEDPNRIVVIKCKRR